MLEAQLYGCWKTSFDNMEKRLRRYGTAVSRV